MQTKVKLMISAIFATIVYFLGVFTGIFVVNSELNKITEDFYEQTLLLSSFLTITNLGLEKIVCDKTEFNVISKRLALAGFKLEYLEKSKYIFKDEKRLQKMKNFYFLLEMIHYSYAKLLKERCNFNWTIIIYFYSHKENISDCEYQGNQLMHLKKKYGDEVLIYNFDFDYDNPVVDYLKIKFNITKVPTLIINDKIKLEGRHSWQEIEKLILS